MIQKEYFSMFGILVESIGSLVPSYSVPGVINSGECVTLFTDSLSQAFLKKAWRPLEPYRLI